MPTNFPVHAPSLNGTTVRFSIDAERLVYAKAHSTGYIRGQVGNIDVELVVDGALVGRGSKRSVSPWNGRATVSTGYLFTAQANREYELTLRAPNSNADNYGALLTADFADRYGIYESYGCPEASIVFELPSEKVANIVVQYHSALRDRTTHGFTLYLDSDVKSGDNATNGEEATSSTTLVLPRGRHTLRAAQWTSQGAVARGVRISIEIAGTMLLRDRTPS